MGQALDCRSVLAMLLGGRHGFVMLAMRESGEGQEDVPHLVVLRSLHAFFFGDRDLGSVI